MGDFVVDWFALGTSDIDDHSARTYTDEFRCREKIMTEKMMDLAEHGVASKEEMRIYKKLSAWVYGKIEIDPNDPDITVVPLSELDL